MNKQQIYKLLEDKMLKYSDLAQIPVKGNGEKMINLSDLDWLETRQIDERMELYTGINIYVRESIAKRLEIANRFLQSAIPNGKLQIVYGYRALEIQQGLYKDFYSKMKNEFKNKEELQEAVHRLIAVPEVSGHPTGGAIDVEIVREDCTPLNMGTKIWEFVEDSYTFSPFIERQEWKNRQILGRIMILSGFAPFDGEWWHFSYGDREWAQYYNKSNAIYEQIKFKM